MKRRKQKILVVITLVIASLVMSVLPHHHHHEKICFERIECEMDHVVNDEHTGHEHSDNSHPENCISSVSFLPQHWLKLAIFCLGISLLCWGAFRFQPNMSGFRIGRDLHLIAYFIALLTGFHTARDGRAPPMSIA